MTLFPPSPTEDPTIEALLDSNRRLGIVCSHCSRFRYMKAARYALDQKLSEVSASLTCSRCGSDEVNAVAVGRDAETGFWPAERS